MTKSEAAQLVIQAGAMARGGDVFVLDMGEPVKILNLAKTMIRLQGLKPYENGSDDLARDSHDSSIEIIITGLRHGEKLYEELLIGNNPQGTEHPKIMTANEQTLHEEKIKKILLKLENHLDDYDLKNIKEIFLNAPIDFQPKGRMSDIIFNEKIKYQKSKSVIKVLNVIK